MNYSRAQTSSLSEEGSPAGVKLEAVMEHLQRQQEAKMEMNLQEKHLQLQFAQQAAAAGTSWFRPDLFGTPGGRIYQSPPQVLSSGLRRMDSKEEEDDEDDNSDEEVLENEEGDEAKKLQMSNFQPYPGCLQPKAEEQNSTSPPLVIKQEQEEKNLSSSPVGQHSFTSPSGFPEWSYDEPYKQRGVWTDDSDGGKVRGEPSRDFAKLYELDSDPQRKEFLDELFVFMQKRGTPVNRIPIMAKQVLDLYKLFKLVTEKGGLVEVINKKIWREITKGLNLPTSITSAAFTLRTQYMKYLYPFECEKKGLSSPGELQAAIDSNRREGRRPGYTNSLYRYSPTSGPAPHTLLPSPSIQANPTTHNGLSASGSPHLKRNTEETLTPVMPRLPVALGQQQQHLAQTATLEHLRERLDRAAGGAATADGPKKKILRLAEEQQRLMQQALQQNLLAMASHFSPMNLKLNNGHEKKQDLSLSISTDGPASISVSVEVNGTIYSGTLFAQKSAAPGPSQTLTPAGASGFSALPSSPSSSTSSKGPN
ncbi:AT-rich interactive domain-containing protein 3B [Oryzias melastigma]|uniref:AT-rich interactive domain-containing protein 3 n=1 Tax=Oryzias melastigma TaxID=30732 RepID=A0A834BWL5_ORYME|nr:AT-rich interactive domain-containing protein 3B [Oryzias melastigma]